MKKILSIILIIIVISVMTLFALRIVNNTILWFTLAVAAALAWWVIPKMKN